MFRPSLPPNFTGEFHGGVQNLPVKFRGGGEISGSRNEIGAELDLGPAEGLDGNDAGERVQVRHEFVSHNVLIKWF